MRSVFAFRCVGVATCRVALRRNFIFHAGCPVSAENMVEPLHGTACGKPFEYGIA
jgi:hypothetical protein